MNIFCSSTDPVLAAQALDDKRLIKMILETGQILSTALYNLGYWRSNLYHPTHRYHPSVKWAQASRGNFNWLVLHGLALNEEYKFRFERSISHKSTAVILDCATCFKDCRLDATGMTRFPNCTSVTGNITIDKIYRQYLIQKWRLDNSPKWTKRGPPVWYKPLEKVA